MSGEFILLGNSITDRSNRVTLVKSVAQRLGISGKGYVEFYLLNGNIVIRKGQKEYDPDSGRTGFYMGSSVVDKENRATLIRLVVQNLQIDQRSVIDFFLYQNEIIIREEVILFQPFTEVNVRALTDENKELALNAVACFMKEADAFIEANGGISVTRLHEILAKVQEETLREVSPNNRKLMFTIVMQRFHELIAPKDIESMIDKTVASQLIMMGCQPKNLKEQIELMKRTSRFIGDFEKEGHKLSDKKKRDLLEKHGLERAESGKGIRLKKK